LPKPSLLHSKLNDNYKAILNKLSVTENATAKCQEMYCHTRTYVQETMTSLIIQNDCNIMPQKLPTHELGAAKTNSSSASQEIPHILQNPKIHYRDHNSLPLAPILAVHTLLSYFLSI
jgi:hypothetical protein